MAGWVHPGLLLRESPKVQNQEAWAGEQSKLQEGLARVESVCVWGGRRQRGWKAAPQPWGQGSRMGSSEYPVGAGGGPGESWLHLGYQFPGHPGQNVAWASDSVNLDPLNLLSC